MADRDRNLDSLRRGAFRCRRCRLHRSRTHAVPGEGAADAGVVLVGEAPGREEDEAARPFVGDAGRYLDELLERAGLFRERVFLTSVVKCRPPGNRVPRADELAACVPSWLDPQLAAIRPELVVLLGRVAIRGVLGKDRSVESAHGSVVELDDRRCVLTAHPAAGMRFPSVDAMMQDDMRRLRELLR